MAARMTPIAKLGRAYRAWRTAVDADMPEDVLEARASAVFAAVADLLSGETD
jgi:rhamnogalacturonyl hydrolase YesR